MPERIRPTVDTGPGLTKQSFKDECDVNFIMNKWKRTGELPAAMVGTMPPSYGDFSHPDDYMTALNKVIDAKDAFAALPSFLRDRFANQPANLLRFLADPANQAEAVRLGLAEAAIAADPPADPAPDPPKDPLPPGEPEGVTVS